MLKNVAGYTSKGDWPIEAVVFAFVFEYRNLVYMYLN